MGEKWYDDKRLETPFIKLPAGATKELHVKEIKRVDDEKGAFCFKNKDGQSMGYRYELITHDGKILTISAFSLLSVLKAAEVDENDVIKLTHVNKGQYTLTMIEKSRIPF